MLLSLTISCSSKSKLVLPFLVLPFWYLLTRVVPDKFQKSSKTTVCVLVILLTNKQKQTNGSENITYVKTVANKKQTSFRCHRLTRMTYYVMHNILSDPKRTFSMISRQQSLVKQSHSIITRAHWCMGRKKNCQYRLAVKIRHLKCSFNHQIKEQNVLEK